MGQVADAAVEGIEAWNAGDRDRLRASVTDDVTLHEAATGRRLAGEPDVTGNNWAWKETFPDGQGEIGTVIEAGDRAVIEVVWRGTHSGPLRTPDGATIPPTGRRIEVPGCMVFRVRDGKVAAMSHYFDLMTLMTQLEVLPAPQAA
jgi:steroid delta-isomerase-like uncharacterized protein